MTTINIEKQFSKHPIGRYLDDSNASGQAFREQHLAPALRKSDEPVTVILDGVAGFPSSFLEEAFGGLVRVEGFERDQLRKRLKLSFQDTSYETYVEEIWFYVEEAERENESVAVAM